MFHPLFSATNFIWYYSNCAGDNPQKAEAQLAYHRATLGGCTAKERCCLDIVGWAGSTMSCRSTPSGPILTPQHSG